MPILIASNYTRDGHYLAGWPLTVAQADEYLANGDWLDLEWADPISQP